MNGRVEVLPFRSFRSMACRLLLVTIALLFAAPASRAQQLSPLAACAAYDHHVVTLIEDLGLSGEADPKLLSSAAMRVLEARKSCKAGDHVRAFKIYETIGLHQPPMTSFYRVLH